MWRFIQNFSNEAVKWSLENKFSIKTSKGAFLNMADLILDYYCTLWTQKTNKKIISSSANI